MKVRVIDRQAIVDTKTIHGEVTINKKSYPRRLIEADSLITLVQECGNSIHRDAWETEGDVRTADNTWTAVYLWTGDKLCSSSTYRNTGNPRPLVERYVVPVAAPRSCSIDKLHALLENKYERAIYADRGQPENSWYKAGWEEIRDIVARELMVGSVFAVQSKRELLRYAPAADMVYLMREEGTDWIKIGKCSSGATSPPAKRRSMYQRGNRREIYPVAAWEYNGTNPEAAMKSVLKAYCATNSIPCRSEWFQVGAEQSIQLLTDILAVHEKVSESEFGR